MALVARALGPATVIKDLHQKGSLKALFPRPANPRLDMVVLNTAGGVTGNDRFDLEVTAEPNARLSVSTQAAERAYKAPPGEIGTIRTQLTLHPGAHLHWLPQETILFDQAALRRQITIDMAPDATALIVEPVIFGRRAMGETVNSLYFQDSWTLHRDGTLTFADRSRISGDAAHMLTRAAVADGATAMAQVLYAAPDAEAHLAAIRHLLPATGGASMINDTLLVLRLLAPTGFALRRSLIPVIERLSRAPLPKVWTL